MIPVEGLTLTFEESLLALRGESHHKGFAGIRELHAQHLHRDQLITHVHKGLSPITLSIGARVKFKGNKHLLELRFEPADILADSAFAAAEIMLLYQSLVNAVGGYAMIFETQIYPFGQQDLVKRIKEKLCLSADCPRAIPEGIIERFMNWHNKTKT